MGTCLNDRYLRNFNSLSLADQNRLKTSHVAVIGLGGLGGTVCELLARIGVECLTLVDGDRFNSTNLNRQVLSREDNLGCFKADEAKKRIEKINSSVKIGIHKVFAGPENIQALIRDADLVMDCLDTISDRFVLELAAQKGKKPLVSGAIAGGTGQVTVIFPQDRGFELIYGSPASIDASKKGIETQVGNLSYCACFIASLQVSEAVKILIGKGEVLRNKLLIADLWTHTLEVMDLI
ncbi:MAG: HesA/MoeB/ThiF family protein [Desulfobacter sp.]|nr:HesA/MoeB/ThiF family protein [Desulfobacter sp.]WDP86248.1 MAG: HesA/MoeB/ThiF family protein [Desulfobacter sp.]